MTVESGQCVGYLGPNGAGKTTTLKILTDLLRPTSGKAYLNGKDVIRHPEAALEGVGAVVETPEFYPQLTPRESFSYVGAIRGLSDRAIAERTCVVLEKVKLLEAADRRIGTFSKGMKQRLVIAQALLHEPSILILDEPTSGLDPRGMVEARDIVKELKKTDITILMSSHLLYEVQEVCDKVAIIDRGTLLTYDSVENLSAGQGATLIVDALKPVTPREFNTIKALKGVTSVTRAENKKLIVSVSGGAEEQAKLLRGILNSGVRVVSFTPQNAAIEGAYLHLVSEGGNTELAGGGAIFAYHGITSTALTSTPITVSMSTINLTKFRSPDDAYMPRCFVINRLSTSFYFFNHFSAILPL